MAVTIPAHVREQQINALPNIQFVRWVGTYSSAHSKAVCRCTVDGYEWAAMVTNLIDSGTRCPHCSGKRRWTSIEREQQINALPNIKFVRWGGTYRGAKSKAVCRCDVDGYEWATAVSNLINGSTGCPQCSGKRRWTAEERISQINALPNIEFIRWVDGYVNNESKAVCRCQIDGFEWAAGVNMLISSGTGCPQCGGTMRRGEEYRINQINALPNIEFVRWDGIYKNSYSKAICRCAVCGGEWAGTVNNLVNNGRGCTPCGRGAMASRLLIPAKERERQINALPNIKFIRWENGYSGSKSKAVCRCEIDGCEWSATPSHLLSTGTGCPQCGGRKHIPADEHIARINTLPNIKFVRWAHGFKNISSKAVCRCAIDGFEWAVTVQNLVHHGRGCPKCATIGYQPSKPGTLYFLRSECGSMVKIGISNNYKQRHSRLRRRTPFNWHCIELLHDDDGSLIAEWEKELHSWTEPAIFLETFDGYTEWRKWDDRLLRWIKRYRARLARYNKAP